MFSEDRKYFRFRFIVVLVLAFLSLISPTHGVSVPKGCVEVAVYVAKIDDWNQPNLLNATLANNFIECIQEVYKIYKETDWKAVQKILPREVRDLVLKVQNMGESTSAIVKRGGPGFVSLYLLYKTLDMYDRAMNLGIDYKMHREEFELLQMEFRSFTEFIDTELMPIWDHLDSATLHMTRAKLITKLSRLHAALVQLARVVYKDIKKGENERRWSLGYGVVSTAVCVGSIFIGNVPGGMACAGSALSGISVASLTVTINKLATLLEEMAIMALEIKEYRTLLEQKPIPGIRFGISNLFLVLSVFLWLKTQGRDH
ncbi:hypothetical protein ACROYT_G010539 [Oculina patagonica]